MLEESSSNPFIKQSAHIRFHLRDLTQQIIYFRCMNACDELPGRRNENTSFRYQQHSGHFDDLLKFHHLYLENEYHQKICNNKIICVALSKRTGFSYFVEEIMIHQQI